MIIKVENLRLRTIVGIFEWEKKNKQDLIINLEMEFDGSVAVKTDDIEDTVDYKTINKKIIQFVQENEFNLIEKIAGGIGQIVMGDSKIKKSVIKVEKPGALRFSDSVSVTHIEERT